GSSEPWYARKTQTQVQLELGAWLADLHSGARRHTDSASALAGVERRQRATLISRIVRDRRIGGAKHHRLGPALDRAGERAARASALADGPPPGPQCAHAAVWWARRLHTHASRAAAAAPGRTASPGSAGRVKRSAPATQAAFRANHQPGGAHDWSDR